MKILLFPILLFCLTLSSAAQTSVSIEKDLPFPDLRVEIGEDISFPDIKVKIGARTPFEDLTVGLTDSRAKANFVITKSSFPDKRILYGKSVSFEDLKIVAGENVNFPDITIEVRNSGVADYWIYSEKGSVSNEEIVLCLLEVIQKKLKKQ